jgi:hypothetical protein
VTAADDNWDVFNVFNGGLFKGVVFIFDDGAFQFAEDRLASSVDFRKREAFSRVRVF